MIQEVLSKLEILEIERLWRRRAREKVKVALRNRRLTRTHCTWFDCYDDNTEAHHPDYRHPLNVIWLCRRHHMSHHKTLRWRSRLEAYREMFGLDQ